MIFYIEYFIIFYYVTSLNNILWFVFGALLSFLILPIQIVLLHFVLWPVEKIIYIFYKKQAKKILDRYKGIKIGITGSFGKTSVKNILTEMLKTQFKVLASPQNFNTPMGVCKTILKKNIEQYDFIIFEMGARKIGDIKELMLMINPDIAILTSIGNQHLETFKNQENIINTKKEIIDFLKEDGTAYFNGENEFVKEIYEKCDKKKILTVSRDSEYYCEQIKLSCLGSEIQLHIKDNIKQFHTNLLGKINCQNIAIAGAVASDLGVSFENICYAVKTLKPIKNRMELIKKDNFLIIDDSYNANEIGCSNALDVINLFDGKKIVITSGIVEMGNEQFEINYLLGKKIGLVADVVVIMNETNRKAIYKGLYDVNFSKKNIYNYNTRDEEIKFLKEQNLNDSIILFQNDLPDNYL